VADALGLRRVQVVERARAPVLRPRARPRALDADERPLILRFRLRRRLLAQRGSARCARAAGGGSGARACLRGAPGSARYTRGMRPSRCEPGQASSRAFKSQTSSMKT
jgi:hypothetical protein